MILLTSLASAAQPVAPTLRFEPGVFRLWKNKAAAITVEAPGTIDEVVLTTSRGRIAPPERSGPGRFIALWQPPEEGFPQLALFTAHIRVGGSWQTAHGVLPLWGLGDAVVRATPSSRIRVRIGDRVFGPVKTNASGIARVPVEVRPGERSAWHGAQEIPLGIPGSPRAHASSPITRLWTAKPQVVRVSLFAVTPSGESLPDPKWKLSVDRGELSAPASDGAGGVEVAWTIPPGPPGSVHLRAVLEGAEEVTASLVLPVQRGPVSRLVLEPSAPEARADDPVVTIHARALDDRGEPIAAEIRITGEPCASPSTERRADGTRWRCALPRAFNGARSLEVRAVAEGIAGELVETLSLPLRGGAPKELRLEPARASLIADGIESVTLRLVALDAWGNPASAAEVPALSLQPAGAGELTFAAEGGGVVLRPLDRSDDLEATVEVRLGELRGSAALNLLAHRMWLSVTPKVGIVSNFHDVSAPEAGVEAGTMVRAGKGQVVLGGSVGTFAFAPLSNDFGVTGDTRYLPALAQAGYRLPLSNRIALTGLCEGGAAWVSDALQLPGQPRAQSAAWVPAGAVGARLEIGIWRGGVQLAARGLFAGDPALPTLSGRFVGLSAGIGYRLEVL